MKPNLQLIRKKRRFSKEFKKSLVSDFESGRFSVLQLSRLHQISNQTIYNWITKLSTFNDSTFRIVEMKDSTSERLKHQDQKIKDLERIVGQKQINIEFLEKMIELAKADLGIDIKKNYSTPQSTGSESTEKD
jgi:transposase